MPRTDHIDPEDRQQAELDFRQRVIDLTKNNQVLPEEDIYDEPVRYYKLNKRWAPIIFGLLNWLENTAGWPQAEDDNYSGIQQVMKYEQGIDLALEIDCEQIEACLETSTIINNLNVQITNLNETIVNLTEQIEDIDNEQATDGVVLPDNPTMPSGADALCRAATYVSMRLADSILEIWEQAEVLTIQEFTDAILGTIWFDFEAATGFWQYAATVADPTLATEAQAYTQVVRDALFCAELDKQTAMDMISDISAIPIAIRSLWVTVIENYRQVQLDEWAAIGTLSSDASDCTDGCPWKIVFDFASNYTPVGDETAIYTGVTWNLTNCHLEAGVGILRTAAGAMLLSLDLPEQCRLLQYTVSARDSANCLRQDLYAWVWRNSISAEAWGNDVPVSIATFNNIVIVNSTADVGHIMSHAEVRMIADTCTGSSFDAGINRITLIGRGAYPQL